MKEFRERCKELNIKVGYREFADDVAILVHYNSVKTAIRVFICAFILLGGYIVHIYGMSRHFEFIL